MEVYLKISKVEYLSNQSVDLSKILNLHLGDQAESTNGLKWRLPPMEDDLKILKVEYVSNLWLDLS